MDGIFGVGLAEMLLIALTILVVGGPRNAAKWARDLGRMLASLRRLWQQMMGELERELGEDGKELIQATRELQHNVNQLRNAAHPTTLARQMNKMVQETTAPLQESLDKTHTEITEATKTPPPKVEAETTNGRYEDWTNS